MGLTRVIIGAVFAMALCLFYWARVCVTELTVSFKHSYIERSPRIRVYCLIAGVGETVRAGGWANRKATILQLQFTASQVLLAF